MTDAQLDEHLEFVDGVQKAQMLVLRLLLRDRPELKTLLGQYAEQMNSNPPADDLSSIQVETVKAHLLSLSK